MEPPQYIDEPSEEEIIEFCLQNKKPGDKDISYCILFATDYEIKPLIYCAVTHDNRYNEIDSLYFTYEDSKITMFPVESLDSDTMRFEIADHFIIF